MRTEENIVLEFVIQTAKNGLYAEFLSERFHSNNLLFCSIISALSWRKLGHLMEKWQDVSRGEERDTVGLLGNSQQDPPQFQILHMI